MQRAAVHALLLLGGSSLTALWLLTIGRVVQAGDWPAYRRDNARSGVTSLSLELPLAESWTRRSLARPHMAWPGPAKWDGYNKVYDLADRMTFDRAFQVVVADGRLLFGSSIDDSVHCLDAVSGRELWTFPTEGPVRFAPAIVAGHAFFGSDDGCVYKLGLADGELIWKRRIGPEDLRVAGNERLTSLWPVRTGLSVREGSVYATAGVFPWEGVHVVQLDADSGEPRWRTRVENVTAQGYLLASASKLYVPAGRDRPVVFDIDSGRRLYQVKGGGGGTYALITGDELAYGPGKGGELSVFPAGTKDQLATFQGIQMLVQPGASYLLSKSRLSRLDRPRYLELSGQRNAASSRKAKVAEQLARLLKKRVESDAEKAERQTTEQTLRDELASLEKRLTELRAELPLCFSWNVPCEVSSLMVQGGEHLYVGGRRKGGSGCVRILNAQEGRLLQTLDVSSDVYGLAIAGGRLYVSTDDGNIACFGPQPEGAQQDLELAAGDDDIPVPEKKAPPPPEPPPSTPTPPPTAKPSDELFAELPETSTDDLLGPFIRFLRRGTIEVTWYTPDASKSHVELGPRGTAPTRHASEKASARQEHRVEVDNIARETLYDYRIVLVSEGGETRASPVYLFDSSFDDSMDARPELALEAERSQEELAAAELAELLADTQSERRGYWFLIEPRDTCLARELVRRRDWQVVLIVEDPERARSLREELLRDGIHGWRASVHRAAIEDLPHSSFLADGVVVSEAELEEAMRAGKEESRKSLGALARILRPAGGVLAILDDALREAPQGDEAPEGGAGSDAPEASELKAELNGIFSIPLEVRRAEVPRRRLAIARRAPLEGAGEWSHQYGPGGNSAASGDSHAGGAMRVQWWGRPGPRPMPDRGNRNPAPLSAGGRLFTQGDRILFGQNAYNGSLLWTMWTPTLRRTNMPRDTSNMTATADTLYFATGPWCVAIDAATGERVRQFRIPESSDAQPYDWGYLSVEGDRLIGGATRRGGAYVGDKGEWYEDFEPDQVGKVTSDYVFQIDRRSGKQEWFYADSPIVNSTLANHRGQLWFVESRNSKARENQTGRLTSELREGQRLVSIDVETGRKQTDTPVDLSRLEYTLYLAAADDVVLISGTDRKKTYHTSARSAETGELLWEHHAEVQKTHHSGHLMHPVLVDGKVWVNKHTYDMRSGKVLKVDPFDYHGCGTMSASDRAIFHRFEYHGMMDLASGQRTEFVGVRGGCWLGQIPAAGLLLAPESGAGCSCTHAIQTSMAFLPLELAE